MQHSSWQVTGQWCPVGIELRGKTSLKVNLWYKPSRKKAIHNNFLFCKSDMQFGVFKRKTASFDVFRPPRVFFTSSVAVSLLLRWFHHIFEIFILFFSLFRIQSFHLKYFNYNPASWKPVTYLEASHFLPAVTTAFSKLTALPTYFYSTTGAHQRL